MTFHYGLGTHFNVGIPDEELALMSTRFTLARIDAQKSSGELARQMISDVYAHGMKPLTIFDTPEQQEDLPDGEWVELQNEVNIGLGRPSPMPANQYRDNIAWAYEIAQRKGQTLFAGAAANMEKRDINWFHDLRFTELPEDIVAVTHHYVPRDRFHQAHRLNWNPLTWTREYEVEQFRKAIGLTRRWAITEFGYGSGPNSSLTPAEAAGEIAKEWAFWSTSPVCEFCITACEYQIRDSTTDDHDFGIYDEHHQIKQAIFETVPLRTPDQETDNMLVVYEALSRKDAIPHPEKAQRFTSPNPDGTVISVQPDGSVQSRPKGTSGAYETWYDDGRTAVFDEVTPGKKFAILLVD